MNDSHVKLHIETFAKIRYTLYGRRRTVMMLRTKDFKVYKIDLPFNAKGLIDDIYFDDLFWNIQYILTRMEKISDNKVFLISHAILNKPDGKSRSIPLSLSQIGKTRHENSKVFQNEKIDRIQESDYFVEMSMDQSELSSLGAMEMKNHIMNELFDLNGLDAPTAKHLRSRNDVIGYNIQAKNGELIGHIDDFIMETNSWKLKYLLINTRDWLTGGKKILMSPAWIEKITWSHNLVSIDLKKEAIVRSPAYDPERPLNDQLELKLFKFYARQRYSS